MVMAREGGAGMNLANPLVPQGPRVLLGYRAVEIGGEQAPAACPSPETHGGDGKGTAPPPQRMPSLPRYRVVQVAEERGPARPPSARAPRRHGRYGRRESAPDRFPFVWGVIT